MKLPKTTMFFTVFFSLYIASLAHAAAEEPSNKALFFRGGVPLVQDKLNELFHYSARDNDPKKLLQALKAGAQVNYRGFRKKTALHYVLESTNRRKHAEKKLNTQQLISHKADLNAQDHKGQTPLIISVMHQLIGITQILLAAKANTELPNEDGDTALTKAGTDCPDLEKSHLFKAGTDCPDLEKSHLLIEWGAQPKNNLTKAIYANHIAKHEQEPSAEVIQRRKDLAVALSPFIPVRDLADLIMQYVPNLDIQIMLNRSSTEK